MNAPSLADLLAPVPSAELTDLLAPVTQASAMSVFRATPSYEGSSRTEQHLALWSPVMRSADADLLPEKMTLDSRVRDMVRNDAYVQGGSTIHKDNIVGATYLLNAKPMSRPLFGKADPIWEAEFQEEVETLFTLWAESSRNWVDAQGVKTLTDLVRLAVGVDLAGGEILMSAEWMPDDGRPFRSAVQMIDTDRLSEPGSGRSWLQSRLGGNNKIRGGVERDRRGAPIAYHIRNGHPGDYANPESYIWRRVMGRKPWGRQMILHAFEQMRADQSRGLSTMVAALGEMKMLKSFRKSELQRAVLAATYAASIESELPSADVLRMMGDGVNEVDAMDAMGNYLSAISQFSAGANNLQIDGVKIPVLMPGTKLNLSNPGAESPQGDKWEMSALRYVAATLGVSYEQLSRDYTQTNYSSARASRGETEKHMAARKKRTADRAANFVYGLWLEEAINFNRLECLKRPRVPAYYEGLNAEAYSQCDWIGAGSGLIDPLKETQAYVLQLKNGLTTKEIVSAKVHGGDWRAIARQIARERALDGDLGNPSVYDVDATPQDNALSGTPQERES